MLQARYNTNDQEITGWDDGADEDQAKSALLSLDDEILTASTAMATGQNGDKAQPKKTGGKNTSEPKKGTGKPQKSEGAGGPKYKTQKAKGKKKEVP